MITWITWTISVESFAMMSPNSVLQQTVIHKVLGRGRLGVVVLCVRFPPACGGAGVPSLNLVVRWRGESKNVGLPQRNLAG